MIRLALLWHMHQPFYEDLATGEHILPWVRLHAIKDYWGMVAMLEEFPGVRVTFNLVPSLLVQIQAFAADRAQDPHLQIGLKPADALEAGERAFLVANGFHVPDRMIASYPRYAELDARRNRSDPFTTDDLRDLQVLHKLAWMDPDLLQTDGRLLSLVAKGRGFAESDKQLLREVELELLHAVIPAYRAAAGRGQVELSTSPFYHPILPLLCDTDVHFRAHPHSALPRRLFARPADAVDQLGRAFALHETLFGSKPRGVWPSEGSLSDEVIGILVGQGCRWTATDEAILERSLQRDMSADLLYRPYEVGREERTVACLFRDHALSDVIGFSYQSWDAEAAANDFVGRVRQAGQRFLASRAADAKGSDVPTITVVLDGENAWEHFAGGGRPFLRALYRRLEGAADIETVTMTEAASAPGRRLHTLFPGSWINGDFYIWAGHPDDHQAWTQLAAARDAFDRAEAGVSAEARATAWEELLIAEGSDWFWWYGDDHSSDHDEAFDDLFRRHLRNVYRALDMPAPADLQTPNITTKPAVAVGPVEFPALVSPTLDGAGRFVDWQGSVAIPLGGGGGGTMHQVSGHRVGDLRVAADRTHLFLRLDGPEIVQKLSMAELRLQLLVDNGRAPQVLDLSPGVSEGPRWVASLVVEAAVPFSALGIQAGDRVRVSVLITEPSSGAAEGVSRSQPFEIEVPGRTLSGVRWVV